MALFTRSPRSQAINCWPFGKESGNGHSANHSFEIQMCQANGFNGKCVGDNGTEKKMPKKLKLSSKKGKKHSVFVFGSPLPSPEIVDKCLGQILDEFNFGDIQKAALLKLESKHKWHIYCTKRQEISNTDNLAHSYMCSLKQLQDKLYISHHANGLNFRSMLDEPDLNLCQSLGIDLRCKSIKFVRTFLELSGLDTVFRLLRLIAIDHIRHLNAHPTTNNDCQSIVAIDYPYLGVEMLKHLITCAENLVMTLEGIDAMIKNGDDLQLLIGFLNDAFFYTPVKKEISKSEAISKQNHIATSTPTLNGRHRIAQISAQDRSPASSDMGGMGRKKCRAPKLPQSFQPFHINITVKSKICNILRLLVLTSGNGVHGSIMKLFSQTSKTLGYKSRFQKFLWDLRDNIRISRCHNSLILNNNFVYVGENLDSSNSIDKRRGKAPQILVNDHSTRGDMSDYVTHSLSHNYSPLSPFSLKYPHSDHQRKELNGDVCFSDNTPTAHRNRSSTYGSGVGNHYDSITPKEQMSRSLYDNTATGVTPKHTYSLSSVFTFSPRAPQISILSKGSPIKTSVPSAIKMGVKISTELKPRPRAKREMTSGRDGVGHKRTQSLPSVNGDVTVVYDNATYLHDDNRPLLNTTPTPVQCNKASLFMSRYASAILSLVNSLISYGPGKESIEYRIHLRYEFLMLNIEEIFRSLRQMGIDDAIENHMKLFEFIRRKDEDILNADFQAMSLDMTNLGELFQILRTQLGSSPGYNSMGSFLYHTLLLMRNKTEVREQLWIFLDALIQQITINSEQDLYPHVNLHTQISQFLHRSSTMEAEYAEMINRVNLLLSDLATSQRCLVEMEKKLEDSDKYKEQLAQTLSSVKQEYEKEANKRHQAENAVKLLNDKINQLISAQDIALKEKTVCGDMGLPLKLSKVVMSLTTNNDDNDESSSNFPSDAGSMIKPQSSVVPPPAPPLPGKTDANPQLKRKNIPKPSEPLKSLNWTIIPESKLKNTIWAEMDETWLYKEMDLDEFEQLFSAYHKPQPHSAAGDCNDGQNSSLPGAYSGNSSPKSGFSHASAMSLSIIEGRRAQNCTILLSKLKLSNPDIVEAVLTLDPENILHKDMCEQLLKFVPTQEEINLLNEHGSECESFAKADRFLYDMSKVFRYEHKLQGLNFKKRFREKMVEVKSKIAAIAKASEDVLSELNTTNYKDNNSNEGGILRRILETTLAMGNYMNRGSRSNAFAFSLESLGRLAETRSTANSNFNLLHYLIGFLEASITKIKRVDGDFERNETLQCTSAILDKRLESVKLASKINLGDLDSEMWALTHGLNDLENEVEIHYEASVHSDLIIDPRDMFINGMTVFLNVSKLNFNQLQQSHKLMKLKYEQLIQLLGENIMQESAGQNGSNDGCQNIFMKLDNFLTSYKDATSEYYKFAKVDKVQETPVKPNQHKILLHDSPHHSFNETRHSLASQKAPLSSTVGATSIKKKPSYCRRSPKHDNDGLLDTETMRYGRHGSNVSDWQVKELIEVLQNG